MSPRDEAVSAAAAIAREHILRYGLNLTAHPERARGRVFAEVITVLRRHGAESGRAVRECLVRAPGCRRGPLISGTDHGRGHMHRHGKPARRACAVIAGGLGKESRAMPALSAAPPGMRIRLCRGFPECREAQVLRARACP